MKKYLFILSILLYMLLPSKVLATTGTVYCPDDNDPLNIRDKIGGTLITSAACNATLEILNNNAGSSVSCTKWFQVKYNGKTGYACGLYIKEQANEKAYVMCEENDDPLGFRNTINGSRIDSIPCNTEVEVLSKNAGSNSVCSNWYRIKYNNQEGYACGTYLSSTKNTNNNSSSSSSSSNSDYVVEDDTYDKSKYNTKEKDGTIMCYEDSTDLGLRSKPGGSSVGTVSCGQAVTIEDTYENGTNTTCDYYYKVNTGSKSGYVCGYFVNTTKLTPKAQNYYNDNNNKESYTNELKNKGFPDSYIPYLLEIHARHPNWKFTAENVKKDFTNVVNGESGNGTSLIQESAFSQGYFSMNSNTFDILNDKFSYYPDEGNFLNASKESIAYFLDPRNYLNYKYIFAFETLGYSENQNASVVNDIIKSQDFWKDLYTNGSTGASDDIVKASKEANISPMHVAARIKQEVSGLTTSDSRLGGSFKYNNTSYSGYYNFFNIKSKCSNCSDIYSAYAYEHGWNTTYKGILGGAVFMADNYIAKNQDTLYYEKFDVSRSDGSYEHQYMQNVAVTFQEGGMKYKGYADANKSYLDTAIEFVIPVYSNMPNNAVTAPSIGNPNNYLKDLKVNGTTISGFSHLKQSYDMTLESDVTKVTIDATKINDKATVNGVGTTNINSNKQSTTIIVKSENGKTREYVINFTRKEAQTNQDNNQQQNDNTQTNNVKIDDIMKALGYKYNSSEISGIEINTDASTLLNKLKAYSDKVKLTTSSKSNKTTGALKTGDILNVTASDGSKSYNILLYGDVNGDGKITPADYLQVKDYILKKYSLSGVYYDASDVNKDGKITPADYLQIKDSILGKFKISQ